MVHACANHLPFIYIALDSLERPEKHSNLPFMQHFNMYLPSNMADSNNCQGACVIIYLRCTISIQNIYHTLDTLCVSC